MLQVALPVLLSLDMVHNFYVVAMLAQARQKVSLLLKLSHVMHQDMQHP